MSAPPRLKSVFALFVVQGLFALGSGGAFYVLFVFLDQRGEHDVASARDTFGLASMLAPVAGGLVGLRAGPRAAFTVAGVVGALGCVALASSAAWGAMPVALIALAGGIVGPTMYVALARSVPAARVAWRAALFAGLTVGVSVAKKAAPIVALVDLDDLAHVLYAASALMGLSAVAAAVLIREARDFAPLAPWRDEARSGARRLGVLVALSIPLFATPDILYVAQMGRLEATFVRAEQGRSLAEFFTTGPSPLRDAASTYGALGGALAAVALFALVRQKKNVAPIAAMGASFLVVALGIAPLFVAPSPGVLFPALASVALTSAGTAAARVFGVTALLAGRPSYASPALAAAWLLAPALPRLVIHPGPQTVTSWLAPAMIALAAAGAAALGSRALADRYCI